ncbi:hypothetical protein IEQ44_11940 [Nocardioides sp. Y6]|uniref:Thioesterase family protein n=1 Tax=Nocardioides malaquae TaxID=2773426 RepID=A0ABR9RW78_9ACTN|nr:hypothetical protein [Nocardioides malaquae]MBE7325365.1 hypothetical protein [Nocardioides malaquae]
MSTLIVPSRYCGPPRSGNGGWTAGELAAHVEHGCPTDRADAWPPVRVRLRQPPPLDVTMTVTDVQGTTTLLHDGAVVAEAVPSVDELLPVAPVGQDAAHAAEATYAGAAQHPFPTCFACGPEREEGDGLRIFPGEVDPVEGRRRVAATWTPHPSLSEDWHVYGQAGRHVALPVTWAALDCVGGWAEDLLGRPMVLGQMTARVDALPEVGETHVVVGEHRGSEGRKTFTASTLYAPGGAVVALAEHVWVAVDPERFG